MIKLKNPFFTISLSIFLQLSGAMAQQLTLVNILGNQTAIRRLIIVGVNLFPG